jgi:hypothetical protein
LWFTYKASNKLTSILTFNEPETCLELIVISK